MKVLIACEECLAEKEFRYYAFGREAMYGWHISNLKIYDSPKQLSEFTGLRTKRDSMELYMLERPPQSWCYVEELE